MGSGKVEKPAARASATERFVLVTSAIVIVFFSAQILMYGYGRDQGIYAMVADAVLRGQMPYRDAWDFKPPGIFIVYALSRAIFGPSQIGIRLLEVIGLLATSLALVRLGERFMKSRTAGVLAAALMVLVHAQLEFWHTAQPESFGGMLTIFALLLAAPASRDPMPKPRALFLAGALLGIAGLLKPPLAGGGVVLAAWLARRQWLESPSLSAGARLKQAAKPGLWIALGGASPFVLTLLWFVARGALSDLYRVLFVFTPHYTRLGWSGSNIFGMLYWGFTEWLVTYSSAVTLGVLLALCARTEKEDRDWLLLAAGIIAMHIIGITMQGKFFAYHYGATWPITALIAAFGLEKFRLRTEKWGKAGAALFVVTFLLAPFGRTATKGFGEPYMLRCFLRMKVALGGFQDREAYDRLSAVADVSNGDNRKVAEYLRERVPPDQPVFVWGFEPAIYDLADRRPASRFIYNVPQRVTWSKTEMRQTLMEDLAENPPRAIVVEHNDIIHMVTGDHVDSHLALEDFPEMSTLLKRYRLERKIADMDVYVLSNNQPTRTESP